MKGWLTGGNRGRMPDLGTRELSVLEVIWARDKVTAQEVHAALSAGDIALSTVQSTLERLCRKGLVARDKRGRAYSYRSRLSREQLIGGLIRDLAQDLAGGRLAPMVSGFIEYVSTSSLDLQSGLDRALNKPDEEND